MKATTWLCPVLTLLCATNLVCTAQRGSYGSYPLESMDEQMLQNDYFLSKRNKPSLSIVNPLDVLRQRLLLEIARRQMKENSRQVELNRAILKNVGKRMTSKYSSPLTAALFDIPELQQQQSMKQLTPYELMPTTLIFDYLQQQRRPLQSYDSNALQFVDNYINDAVKEAVLSSAYGGENDAKIGEKNIEPDVIALNGVVGNTDNYALKRITKSNNGHSSNIPNEQHETATFLKSFNNRKDDTKYFTAINNHQVHGNKNDLSLDPNGENTVSATPNVNDYDGDYQIQRYLYHLHKNQNHLTRK